MRSLHVSASHLFGKLGKLYRAMIKQNKTSCLTLLLPYQPISVQKESSLGRLLQASGNDSGEWRSGVRWSATLLHSMMTCCDVSNFGGGWQQTGLEPAPFAIRANALTNYATAALTDRVEIPLAILKLQGSAIPSHYRTSVLSTFARGLLFPSKAYLLARTRPLTLNNGFIMGKIERKNELEEGRWRGSET
ncbi:hypothetical protein evm_002004 [Chilo suppressalis]|nr:hypothetical protein evm_002004 [Chilo suppressalis]